MEIRQLDGKAICLFKMNWPCHGFPTELDGITAAFADNGDLVDFECYDERDNLLDSHDFDGPALAALVDDCQRFGTVFSRV